VDYGVFLLWLLTAAAEGLSLLQWVRRRRAASRFPTPLVVWHIGTAVAVLTLWIVYLATDSIGWAWGAFAVFNVTNGLGDTISTGRFRDLTGLRSGWWRDYGRAVTAVLKGRRPPAPTVHALAAGVVYFGTLAACLMGT
jgi:hypothetical protein